MSKRMAAVLAVLAGLAIGAAARAKSVEIVYHHATNVAETRLLTGEPVDAIKVGSGDALDLRFTKAVGVAIDDPNPVLFNYTQKPSTFVTNPDYAEALKFATALQPLKSALDASEVAKEAAREARGLPRAAAQVDPIEKALADFKKAVADLLAIVDSIPNVARQTAGGATEIQSAKQTAANWKLTEIESQLTKTFEELHARNQKHIAGTARLAPADAELILAALAEESRLLKMLGVAKAFATAVGDVGKRITLEPVKYDLTKNETVNLTITPVADFAAIAKASGRYIGDVAIPTQPYYPARFSFGPALLYSFVKSSDFTTEALPDGKFKIVEKGSDYRGTNVSAVFTITPRSWDQPTFGGGFQIGVSPVKNQIGFFAGGRLKIANDLLGIGFGYGYQQVPKLAKGLDVNVPIAKPADLKTDPDFRGGFYVSFDVKVLSTK